MADIATVASSSACPTVCLLPRKPFLNGTALGVQSTRSLRRSCSTVCATPVPLYQLIESGGNIKAVQGNTGHATTGILMDTYAHTQDKPRLELAEKLEADFYSQDIGSPKSGSVPVKENLPDSIQITPEGMLKVVRQMNPEQRREFTRLLFA